MLNVSSLARKIPRSEISGAFADLGLLIPLEAALIAVNGLNPTSTLLGVGVVYIAAGWYFRLPVPVQPLKALAAIAIARELAPDVIAAGALLMSLSLVFLAATGLIDRLYAIVPTPVIRGVQLGLAYVLIRGALRLLGEPLSLDTAQTSLSLAGLSLPLMVALAPLAVLGIFLMVKKPILPASLAILAVGIGVGLYLGRWQGGAADLGPAGISIGFPGSEAFATAAAVLLTAQLPLTISNSVIATRDAVKHYFPERAARATPRRLSWSIALSNLWAGLFGGLPSCHGCGGLTAHYSMGARTQLATTILGITLIVVALAFGTLAQSARTLVPLPFFGILLLYVGLQHIALAVKVERPMDLAFIGLAGVVTVVFDGNLAYTAGLTLAAYWATQWLGTLRRPGPGRSLEGGTPLPSDGSGQR